MLFLCFVCFRTMSYSWHLTAQAWKLCSKYQSREQCCSPRPLLSDRRYGYCVSAECNDHVYTLLEFSFACIVANVCERLFGIKIWFQFGLQQLQLRINVPCNWYCLNFWHFLLDCTCYWLYGWHCRTFLHPAKTKKNNFFFLKRAKKTKLHTLRSIQP